VYNRQQNLKISEYVKMVGITPSKSHTYKMENPGSCPSFVILADTSWILSLGKEKFYEYVMKTLRF